MKTNKLIAVALAALMVTACQQPGQYPGTGVMNGGSINKQDIGTVGGAIGGGIIGSNVGKGKGAIAGTIVGALLGGAIGSNIGQSLDNADRAAADAAASKAFETGQSGQKFPWSNAQSGNSGSVTPANYYTNSNGQYCREYTQTINVGGKTQQGHGTACRQPDGTWQIVQ